MSLLGSHYLLSEAFLADPVKPGAALLLPKIRFTITGVRERLGEIQSEKEKYERQKFRFCSAA